MALTKVQNTGIADDAVTTDKIENSTVLAADLAASSVTNAKIATGTIGNDKLTNSSITINGSSLSLGGSTTLKHIDWQAVTVADGSTTLSASAGKGYFLDTNAGVIEVFLPSSPSRGDTIVLADYSGTFATNQIIINTGGQNIDSTANSEVKVTTNNSIVELVYVDANKGWLVKLNQAAGTTPSSAMGVLGDYDTNPENFPFITATGGTITTTGDFKVHTFTGDGTFDVTWAGQSPAPSNVDYLVIAGGAGGGGGNGGGGGGAGGYRTTFPSPSCNAGAFPIARTSYPISVGGGGTATPSAPGSNSVFSTITSAGGGLGGKSSHPTRPTPGNGGGPGGSGGGAGGSPLNPGYSGGSGNTPPVSPPQGNNGGSAGVNPGNGGGSGGGGGGGAGGNGSNGSPGTPQGGTGNGGNGGNGAANSITGSPVTRAGGGAAGSENGNGGDGGPGGGGDGGDDLTEVSGVKNGTAGSANTGSGGGGGGNPVGAGAAGGKGVVIIRYKFQSS